MIRLTKKNDDIIIILLIDGNLTILVQKEFETYGPVEKKRTMNDAVLVTATCDREFVKLLQAYKTLKANKQTLLLALCLVILLPFTYALGFLAVFLLIT